MSYGFNGPGRRRRRLPSVVSDKIVMIRRDKFFVARRDRNQSKLQIWLRLVLVIILTNLRYFNGKAA